MRYQNIPQRATSKASKDYMAGAEADKDDDVGRASLLFFPIKDATKFAVVPVRRY